MSELDDEYQEILLSHYRQPRNRAMISDDEVLAEEDHPLCGDHIRIAARCEEGRLVAVRFDGKGCLISQASASLMTEHLEGRTVSEARTLISRFIRAMRDEADASTLSGELRALSGVRKYAMRVKCATLSWHCMQKALDALAP